MDYIINSRTKKIEIFCETPEEIQEITQVLSNYKTAGKLEEIKVSDCYLTATNSVIIPSKTIPRDSVSISSINSSDEGTGIYY